jgi:hypothetical protein
MTVTLKQVVPYGRSRREYVDMFGLTGTDLQQRILGCADGPASFNAEATADGCQVVSVDPLYQFTAEEIRRRFYEVADDIIEQVRGAPQNYVWKFHVSPDHLRTMRCAALETFERDFPAGKQAQRYVVGELPQLPFADRQYDLARCSHLLFTYTDQLSTEFHIASAMELCRVAHEVRIFPLIALNLERSRHLEPVRGHLHARGVSSEIIEVDYELQRGGNQMLRLVSPRAAS